MYFDDLVGSSGDIDLKFACFVERTIKESKEALMCDIGSVVGGIFLEFVDDIVGMVITIEQYVLVLLKGSHLKNSFLQDDDHLPLVLDILVY